MKEKSRILVFADTHRTQEEQYEAIGEIAEELGVDSTIFAGDSDLHGGYERIAELADFPLLGNHDYCWGNLIDGQIAEVPHSFRDLASDPCWENPSPKVVELFTRFRVNHIFQRINFRHSLAPYMVGNRGPTDEEFAFDWMRVFLPQVYLGQQFWAAHTDSTMKNGSSDPNSVLHKVFQYMRRSDQRLLVNGHEHIDPAIESVAQDGTIQVVPLVPGKIYENIPSPARLRLPAFCDTGAVVVLDVSSKRIDVELKRV